MDSFKLYRDWKGALEAHAWEKYKKELKEKAEAEYLQVVKELDEAIQPAWKVGEKRKRGRVEEKSVKKSKKVGLGVRPNPMTMAGAESWVVPFVAEFLDDVYDLARLVAEYYVDYEYGRVFLEMHGPKAKVEKYVPAMFARWMQVRGLPRRIFQHLDERNRMRLWQEGEVFKRERNVVAPLGAFGGRGGGVQQGARRPRRPIFLLVPFRRDRVFFRVGGWSERLYARRMSEDAVPVPPADQERVGGALGRRCCFHVYIQGFWMYVGDYFVRPGPDRPGKHVHCIWSYD